MNNLIELEENTNKILKENNLNNTEDVLNFIVSDIQNNCLKSDFGKAINSGIDIGIRAMFPDLIEDKIINLKDNIYNYGLKEGFNKTFDETLSFGKATIGIFTNDFESISQAKEAVEKGGTIDKISELLDEGINGLQNSKTIDKDISKTLKEGKNIIFKNIEKNIENSFSNQINKTERLEKYISDWNKYYNNKDFSGMEKEYKKIEKILNSLMPTKNILSEYNTIKNTQNLIKNNGNNFNLSEQEIELLNKLN